MPNISGVALWPRPVIVIIGKPRYDSLSSDQRAWLQQGIDAATVRPAPGAPEGDADALGRLCDDGADDRLARRLAGRGVHGRRQAPRSTGWAPTPSPRGPSPGSREIKAGPASRFRAGSVRHRDELGAACKRRRQGSRMEPTRLTRRARELQAFWKAHQTPADYRHPCPIVLGFTLKDGRWKENYGEPWTYSFFGDHVKLGDFTLRWAYDGTAGDVQRHRGRPPDDASVWTLKPFRRTADEVPLPQVGSPTEPTQ